METEIGFSGIVFLPSNEEVDLFMNLLQQFASKILLAFTICEV